jgi:hypothetical protein
MNPGPFARSIGGLCAAEEPAIVAVCITNARLTSPGQPVLGQFDQSSAFGPASDNPRRKTTRHDCPIFTIAQIWPK